MAAGDSFALTWWPRKCFNGKKKRKIIKRYTPLRGLERLWIEDVAYLKERK